MKALMNHTDSFGQRARQFLEVNGGLHCYALGGWLLFLASPFLFDSYGKVGMVFYFACAVPWLLLLPGIKANWRSQAPINLYWLAFCIYLWASSLWYENVMVSEVARGFRYLLFVLCYMSLSQYLIERYTWLLPQAIKLLVCVTALHAFYSLIHLDELLTPLGRMQGAGAVWNELVAGNAYALASVAVVHFLSRGLTTMQKLTNLEKATYIPLFICLVAGVYFTGSRSSALAAVLVILAMLYARLQEGQRLRYRIVVTLIVGAVLVLLALYRPEYISVLFERGFSFRPDIWSYVIEETAPHWLFGQGYHGDADIPINGGSVWVGHAHSLYLSVYRFGGLLGVVVLVVLLAFTLKRKMGSGKTWRQDVTFWIFVFALLACVVNGRFPIDRPGWIWLVFWIPLSFVLFDPPVNDDISSESG